MSFHAPVIYRPASIMLSTRSFESIGGIGNRGISTSTVASTAWPTANKAMFVPVTLTSVATVVSAWVSNGAAVAGNVDIGIYDVNGNRLVSTGATAQAGTSVVQAISVASTKLGPGRYYLAIGFSSGSATVIGQVPALAALLAGMGCAEMAAAVALPATATLALNTIALLPLFGFSQRTLVA